MIATKFMNLRIEVALLPGLTPELSLVGFWKENLGNLLSLEAETVQLICQGVSLPKFNPQKLRERHETYEIVRAATRRTAVSTARR